MFGLFRKTKQNEVPVGSIWCNAVDVDNPFMADPNGGMRRPLYKVIAVNGDWVQFQRGLIDGGSLDTMRLNNWLYVFEPVPKSWNVQ